MKQTGIRILVLVFVLCFIPTVLTGCWSQLSPQEILEKDYYDWSSGSEYTFLWNNKKYQAVEMPTDFQTHMDTFYVEEHTLYSAWNEDTHTCTLSKEEGEDMDYYLLRSDTYPSLYFLVPHKEFRKLFEESRPFAFCLEGVEKQG